MRHQQRESQRTHTKVSKPVKPHVSNCFELDSNLIESMRSDLDRANNSNAIATEKIVSPSVIRNKHIKTMSSLLQNTATPLSNQLSGCLKPSADGQ